MHNGTVLAPFLAMEVEKGQIYMLLIHECRFPNVHGAHTSLSSVLVSPMGLASMLPLPNGIFGRPMRASPPEMKWFFATLHGHNVGHRKECVPSNPCLLEVPMVGRNQPRKESMWWK